MRGTGPLRLLGHEADRPHPAGELARRGHVRLVAVDPAREQRLPPLDKPPHALGGMPPGAPVRGLALGEVLRPPRARQAASTAPPPALVEAENRQVRFLAARISEALDEAGALEAETAALLEGDETYACLLTVPGIGPRTAAQLAVSVDIGRFPDHDHLASYCGIAPRVRSSGTSVRSVRASRRGDARLKSLLIFSCNSLVRSSGRYGEYYRACRARGMGHGRALKAVARKRLRAIYAVMRDRVPYRE